MTVHQCTKQTSIATWMRKFGVGELDWTAQSPDFNPKEQLWDEIEERLLEEWSKIQMNTLLNIVESQAFPEELRLL